MIQNVLHHKLRPLIEAERTLRRRKALAATLFAGALAAGVLIALAVFTDWWSWKAVLITFGVTGFVAMIAVWLADRRTVDVKTIATRIETKHPDLQAALITAVEQRPGPDGRLGYLQERVVFEAVDHAVKHRWVRRVSSARLAGAGWMQFAAALAFGVAFWFLIGEAPRPDGAVAETPKGETPVPPAPPADYEIAVLPGDTEVERGARLIVEAKFGLRVPPGATLVVREPGDNGAERARYPMKAGLDEAVFSGLIAKVESDAVYRIEFDGERSDEFAVATYVHPALERADAEITPPAYANQEKKKIEDVQKVSLLEGSDLAWSMKVNKPVAAAELFGEDESVIALKPSAGDPTVLVAAHQPKETQKYRLHLVDEKDRTNHRPPWFTVTVLKNLPPKLDFVFPKRDVEVSALQELPIEAKLWDDIGILKAGATLVHGEKSRDIVLAAAALPGGKNHEVRAQFSMEELGAAPRDLVAYHLWAEDTGPDGQPRRTQSDMFFAEVRHFEDIFREQENTGGPPPGGGAGQQGGKSEKLMKLQKDVMNANWKLIRDTDMGKNVEEIGGDTGVVRDSQQLAIAQVEEAAGEVEDPELKAHFTTAAQHMGQAVETLGRSIDQKDAKELRPAHDAERKAYEALVRARGREHNVTRAQNQQSASSGQSQDQQAQLMNLEMKQKDLRYEQEKEAQDPQQTAEQKENLEVLNRLKELARRQEAIAKKIQELENALQNAKTEEEKAELDRQLKRLQEEQEQLLRDLDETTEKMNSEENRANMAEERENLEKTREDVREAAEKLEEGKLADAANAATRAERQLEKAKEDFRQKTSRQFEQEMRDIRDRARDLAKNQEALGQKLEKKPENETPLANAGLSREIREQQKQLEELLEKMRQVSQQAEESEPILSTAMYEALREATMGGVKESLEEAGDLAMYNRRELAQESERAAARGIEELKNDVEKAAEKVLGSEADALRMARSELEDLIEQSKQEAERIGGQKKTELAMREPGKPGEKSDPATEGDPIKQGQIGDQTGSDQKPGESEKPGEAGIGKGEAKSENEGKGEPNESAKGKGQGKGKAEGDKEGGGEGQGEPNSDAQKGKGKGEGQGQEPQPGDPQQAGKGKGKGKGQGEGQGQGEPQEGQQPGQQVASNEGEGQQPGQGKGESQQPGEGESEGQGQGKGKGKGESQAQAKGQQPGQSGQQSGQGQSQPRGYRGGLAGGGATNNGGESQRDGGLPNGIAPGAEQPPLFFQNAGESVPEGPITGKDYEDWADRLRNVENMVEADDLRNELAKVQDEARAMRIEFRRNDMPPQANSIDQRITKPLTEIRDRLAEELGKLDKENPLAPIDRDPVPREYRELVRRYYQELGSGK